MALGAYAIHADQIAQHVIARHLLAAVLGQHSRLARTRPDRVQRGERIACAVEQLAFLQANAFRNQFVELLQGILIQPERQAKLTHAAVAAVRLERVERNHGCRRRRHRAVDGKGHQSGREHKLARSIQRKRALSVLPIRRIEQDAPGWLAV
jgi:hypothetical protein